MSEMAPETATPETPAQAPEAPAKPETDWKAEARKWEQRAKEYKPAADRLAEIEEASKTEAQKTSERLATAEKDAADARREALRLRIATRYGIGDEDADLFLTASDEDTLTKQAERLGARVTDQQRRGNYVPREGNNSTSVDNDKRQFAQQLFGE